ncbi:hypothetical protein K492DRAFT_200082 [Lichtheimia hyalospora FSU 10163]|nr:hypothetical protein K492DRAFT_200082 [Lichtheimia hyalospora FSU 10163]
MATIQHSNDTTTLASENNAMGLTNSNAAHNAHGSSLSTSREGHDDQVLQGTKEYSERRIDFISQLPAELAITKIIPMFMDDDRQDACVPCPYLHVSNVWRDRIIQCLGGLWFSIDREQEDHKDRLCSELVQFAQHTRALSIDYYEEWMSDILGGNDFCSLRDVSVEDLREKYNEHFVSSLSSINTLENVSLRLGSISIADLVLTCPNLTTLKLFMPEDAHLNALPVTPCPSMTTLFICNAPSAITNDQVIAICETFPSLKHLELTPCADIQSAFILSDYYPFMKSLDLLIYYEGFGLTYSDQGLPHEEQGITNLAIRHQQTLVSLQWGLKLDSNEDDLYDIPFPRLKKLEFSYSACRIPRNAPMLQELEISPDAISNYPAVLDTIPRRMKKLVITLYRTESFSDAAIIGQYFNRIAQQQNVRLNELVLNISCLMNIEHMLNAIRNLRHLRRLMVSSLDLDIYQLKGLPESLVQGCTELNCLRFKCMFSPSSDYIDTLKRLEHLKEIAFSIRGAPHGLWDSIRTLSQLQRIRIYPASAVNKPDIISLNQHRPDIQVIIHKYSPPFDRA